MPRIAYVLFAVLACVLHAATAYTAQPLRHSRVLARTSARAEVQMMPKVRCSALGMTSTLLRVPRSYSNWWLRCACRG